MPQDAKGANSGPPPLPAPGGGGALKNADAAACKLPPGTPANTVLPCQWKLHIKVHSQERFWPKDSFAVQFGAVKAPATPVPPGPPPISPAWYNSTVKMQSKDAPEVVFGASGAKTGGVTALVNALKKEADWVLAAGKSAPALLNNQYLPESIANGQDQHVDLFIRHPLWINLEFKFKDPEKKVFKFPKDFPIQVWNTAQVFEKKTDEKGRLSFELDRKYDWITLKFGNGPVFFNCADGKPDKCELKVEADRKALIAAKAKFFSPPDTWSLLESIWAFSEQPKFIDGTAAYKDTEGKIYLYKDPGNNWVRRIGEKDAPITLTLDPNWQFNRFEFFDRYYGHSDHAHKRIHIPPVVVDGMWVSGGKAVREGSGHWVLNPKSAPDTVLAVPWIRQKTDKGVKAEKPDKDSYLTIKTAAGTYSVSSDASTRATEVIPGGDKRLNPGVNRLKIYDLPEKWESLKYWTRFGKEPSQTGKFWKDWTAADYLKSRAVASPLTFSLDDVVLTDAGLNPLNLAKTDQFAVFYHRFKPFYDQKANVSNHGVYMPDANEPYYSSIKLKGDNFNYLTDYPNWVRLLAGLACLYDNFDKRAVSGVLGARAGVKWYDPVVSGAPAKGPVGFQAAIDKKEFVLEPYYGQEHHFTWQQFNAGAFRIGRFDMALLRDCDVIGGKELFLTMQYFRMFYNFTPTSNVKGAGPQKAYIKSSAVALMNRWNGNDAANASRAEIVPQDKTKNLTGEVLWFIQPAKGLPDAHFQLDIKSMGANARAWMNGTNGTGEVDDTFATPAAAYGTKLAYILGHELGHGGSMPDEYGEWWNRCSHNGPGISCNIPGDPFADEGRDFDLTSALNGGANPPYPIMTMTVEMRNRYFWHNAEFARKFIKEPMYSKYGATYAEYKVPGHPNYPRRHYTYWPIASAMNFALGAKGQADIYLHAAGKEKYTVALMPGGPYDAILSVLIKLALYEATGNDNLFRNAIRNTILAYNKRYYSLGDATVTTDAGAKNLSYAKSIFRFSPRFLIQATDAKASNAATYPADFTSFLGKLRRARLHQHRQQQGRPQRTQRENRKAGPEPGLRQPQLGQYRGGVDRAAIPQHDRRGLRSKEPEHHRRERSKAHRKGRIH